MEGRLEGMMHGQTDGWMHTRMDEDHFYSPPPPMSGDKKHGCMFLELCKAHNWNMACTYANFVLEWLDKHQLAC